MSEHRWVHELPGAVTVCDREGRILEMNARAREVFAREGGERLIGASLLDCHPEPARTKLRELLARGERNAYTIQKKGKKKLIYQSPWYEAGVYSGFVELSLELPEEMPHFDRDAPKK